LGKKLERYRTCTPDELVEEDLELATCTVDELARALRFGCRQVLHPRQLPLELVGVRCDGVEPDHLDRTGRLVNMRARMLERGRLARRCLESRERIEAAAKRLVDLALHPGQRAEIEFRGSVCDHTLSGPDYFLSPKARSAPCSSVNTTAVRHALRVRARLRCVSYLEPGDRAPQLCGELGELTDRHVGLLGAFGRLFGDLEDPLHAPRHVRYRCRLPLRLRGDGADQ